MINLHHHIFTGGKMLKGQSKLSKTIPFQDYVLLILPPAPSPTGHYPP
jgi:hypothetical protein